MERAQSEELIKEPVQEELYNYIYELSKKDYIHTQVRNFARRSLYFIILILSAAGVFFTAFYFAFLQDYVKNLKDEINSYRINIENLNSEIARLTASETEYKYKLREYEKTFKKLKIEDNRIVDIDLTESVQKSINKVDKWEAEYRNISRGNTYFKETALTFDLGTGEDLPYIYTVLRRFGARATVFISNEMPSTHYGSLFNDRNISYLIKLSQLGCEFGNHTWSHYNLKSSLYEPSKRKRLQLAFVSDRVLDEVSLKLEFDRVRNEFYRETGISLSPFWRSPYGAIDHRILTIAAKAGYPNHVLWSSNQIGPLDFYDYVKKRTVLARNTHTGEYVRQRNPYYFSSSEMLLRLKTWEVTDPHGLKGAIAISHLGTSRKTDKIIQILPEYISFFQGKGYHFVLISEIINDTKDYD